jgi:tRNA pseudouridine32 synthase/23S rRNA pseudouridine746 synthase
MIFHLFGPKKQKPDGTFNNPFYYQPDSLCIEAQKEVLKYLEYFTDADFKAEIKKGKMFGVLIAEKDGTLGFLAAYSGQICGREDYAFFVPAVFDYSDKNGYFKTCEREISQITYEIENSDYNAVNQEINNKTAENEKRISDYKNYMRKEKGKRDKLRKNGCADPESLVRESQFQKAELKRMKEKFSKELKVLEEKLAKINALKNLRKQKSDSLQKWLFSKFEFQNFKGKKKNLMEIFSVIPPSGTGECCAPKLLQYAFQNGFKPLKIAEFWYGEPPKGEVRRHLNFYPACNSKCRPILNFMLEGLTVEKNPLESLPEKQLEIIYDDEYLSVVCKPEGMLSCPDKKNQKSVLSIMRDKFPDCQEIMICHRLDLATSGLMVVAKSKKVFVDIQRQFLTHEIQKTYFAVLEGVISQKSGRISLPLTADLTDSPRQKVDFIHGKEAVTDYEVLEIRNGETIVKFFPRTGRTHQLRVHSASSEGLGAPIKGDEIYGKKSDRMYLHAEKITFTHPITKKRKTFEKALRF